MKLKFSVNLKFPASRVCKGEKVPSFVHEARCPTPKPENTKKEYTLYLNTICTMNPIPLAFVGKSGEQITAVISEQHYCEARVKSTVLTLLSAIFSETRVPFIIIYSTDSSENKRNTQSILHCSKPRLTFSYCSKHQQSQDRVIQNFGSR